MKIFARKTSEQTQDPDPRQSLETHAAQQPKEPREPTPAERNAEFGNEVRTRMSSVGEKKGQVQQSGRQLTPGRVELAHSRWRLWDVIPEYGTTIEDMLDPAYWAHEARKFAPWDQVVIRAEDGRFYAEAIVIEAGQLYVRIALKPGYPCPLQVAEPDIDVSIPDGYGIKWTGPHTKYAVVRGEDRLRDNFSSKGAAAGWLRDHLTVMRRTA